MSILHAATGRIRRAAALSALAVSLVAPAAFLAHGSAKRQPATSVAAMQPLPVLPGSRDRLDLLRSDAALGDEWASSELVRALLDRYDQQGASDDLYEALIWIDTQWQHSGTAPQSGRVVAKYCDQRIVRWHWICTQGE